MTGRRAKPNVALAALVLAWNGADPLTRGVHPTASSRVRGSLGLATQFRMSPAHRAQGRKVREAKEAE